MDSKRSLQIKYKRYSASVTQRVPTMFVSQAKAQQRSELRLGEPGHSLQDKYKRMLTDSERYQLQSNEAKQAKCLHLDAGATSQHRTR